MIERIEVPRWRMEHPWLAHGFTTRRGGVSAAYGPGELNLGYTEHDAAEAVAANRLALVRAFPGMAEMIMVRQVHSAEVRRVDADAAATMMQAGRATGEGDGLVSDVPGLLLGVLVADCVPVLLADTRQRRVAALHAGWRGTAAGIVEAGLRRMLEDGSRVEDLTAAIGPSIGACCYSVGGEVRARFGERYGYAETLFQERDGAVYLDLWEANRQQLLRAGVAAERIAVVAECTACTRADGRRRYFSHRAEQGRTGRAMGVIGVRMSD